MLLIRSITTTGYGDGIRFYLVPEWDRLLDPEVSYVLSHQGIGLQFLLFRLSALCFMV